MTEQDQAQFAVIMTGLAENFGGNLTDEGLDFRFMALSRFPIEQVRAGALKCVETRKYRNMPTIAEIIECIEGGEDDHRVEAEREAQTVLDAVRRYGRYSNVLFTNATTNAVVKALGGWQELCNRREDEEKWFIKNFVEDYGKYKVRGIEDTTYMRGIGTGNTIDVIGPGADRLAIGSNPDGQKKVGSLLRGLCK